jgi:ribosomal protein S18 acetylase RimI-like enzyme
MALGLSWAVFFHGTYDSFLFWQHSPEIKPFVSDLLLFLGAVVSFIVALRLSFKLIARHRLLSQHTFKPGAGLSLRMAFEKDIPIIRDLSLKVWPQTYATILSPEQINYMLEMMYSEQSLAKQMKAKHEFILVIDGNVPVGFASISLLEQGIYKLHKIYILPSLQGKGAGRFVISELVKAIARKGGKALRLNVNRNNSAKDFYTKLGFIITGEEDIDIGSGYFMNDYVMEKKISSPFS